MKAPFNVVNRLAERIFERSVYVSPESPGPRHREHTRKLAIECFDLAEIFGEESERYFQKARAEADTERAKKTLEEANKR